MPSWAKRTMFLSIKFPVLFEQLRVFGAELPLVQHRHEHSRRRPRGNMVRHAHRPAPPGARATAAAACEEPYQHDQEECADGNGLLSVSPWEGEAPAKGRSAGAGGEERRGIGGFSRWIR